MSRLFTIIAFQLAIFVPSQKKGPLSSTKTATVAPSSDVLATIDSDQELGSGGNPGSGSSTPFRERSLMEALLAQKMAQAAKYMRSNSTASIDSACSSHSHLSTSSEHQAFKSLHSFFISYYSIFQFFLLGMGQE